MGKLLIAVLVLVLGYFAFLKRTEPPKEVRVAEDQVEQITATQNLSASSAPVSNFSQTTVSAPVSAAGAVVVTDSVVGDEGSLSDEEKEEPRENVDQTVIANEKRLAEAKSAREVFELLRKLRVRVKYLSDISVPATFKDYSRFWGTYEGPVMNSRREVMFNFKIELKEEDNYGQARIAGNYQILKPGYPAKGFTFSNSEFGVQLVGRDALVINSVNQENYFQFYKLDNGYLAGNYYEKSKNRYKSYRFILKNK